MTYIGIDIGTTNIKAALVSRDGRILHLHAVPNTLETVGDAAGTYKAEQIWQRVLTCLKVITQDTQPPTALCISAMAEAGVLLDAKGEPLCDILPWQDKRTACYLERTPFSDATLYRKTGQPPHTKYPLYRLQWYKEHQPEVFTSACHWLSVGDYIAYRLSGQMVTDYTQATRTMCFNVTTKDWDTEICDFLQARHLFAPVVPMGTRLADVLPEVCSLLGWQETPTVHVGGHDHILALRATQSDMLDSIGTSEVLTGITTKLQLDDHTVGIAQGLITADIGYWMTSFPSAGASLEWFISLLSRDKRMSYNELLSLSNVDIRTNLIYLPYINGRGTPHTDPTAKGSLIGLSVKDGARELLSALYEGLAFQNKLILAHTHAFETQSDSPLIVAGGGTQNAIWMQTKANVLNRRLALLSVQELCAFSAAMLAAGVRPMLQTTMIEPQPDAYYDAKYERFSRLISIL